MPQEGKTNQKLNIRANGARGTSAALEAHYRFALWLVLAVERFSRSRNKAEGSALDDFFGPTAKSNKEE